METKSTKGTNRGESKKLTPATTSGFKLYEINDSISEITDMLSLAVDHNGEIVEEGLLDKITARLNELNLAKEIKATGIAIVLKSLIGESDLISKERERLERREQVIQNKVRWLKGYLTTYLQNDPSSPGLSINSVRASISWRKSDAILINVLDRLPTRFKKYSVTDISEDELLLFGDQLKRLRGLTVEPRKDVLKTHIKSRQQRGRKFKRVALLQVKHTLQIK